MATGIVRLHRVLRAPSDRVYRAFVTADAVAKWLPPDGFTCHVEQLDATVGGRFRMSFTDFATGQVHSFGGTYVELVPSVRICYSEVFDSPVLPGTMTTTVDLKPTLCGTDLRLVQEGIPEAIAVDLCYLGWQDSLSLLARLVEADTSG